MLDNNNNTPQSDASNQSSRHLQEVTKRGVGDYPEFMGLRLAMIAYTKTVGKLPHQYAFQFRNSVDGGGYDHLHYSAEAIDDNNYNFIGHIVTNAYQKRVGRDLEFVFEFGDPVGRVLPYRRLSFVYEEPEDDHL